MIETFTYSYDENMIPDMTLDDPSTAIDIVVDVNGANGAPPPDTSGVGGSVVNSESESTPLFALDGNLLNGNQVFTIFQDINKLKDVFTIDTFFKPVFNVAINSESSSAVRANLTDAAIRANDRLTIDRSDFVGDPSVEEVATNIERITNNPLLELNDLLELFATMKNKLHVEFKNYVDLDTKQIRDEITMNHTLMHKYMDAVIVSIATHYFSKAQLKINEKMNVLFPTNAENAQYVKYVRRAAFVVAAMKSDVIDDLAQGLTYAYDQIFGKITDLRSPIVKDYLKSIGNTEQIASSAFFYNLRKHMLTYVQKSGSSGCANALKIVKATEGNEVYLYTTKLMTDLYLRACIPLVQYAFISAMMKKYMHAGDFVNTRLGLLSKIFYIVIMLYTINPTLNTLRNQVSTTSLSNDVLKTTAFINDALFKFNKYLENMNRININSTTTTTETEMQKIVDDLKVYSNDVAKQSVIISEKKKSIQESRLAMRSILYNIEIIKQQRTKKLIEFYIILSLLLIVSIACIALLILKKNDIVFYVAGAALMGVLLYKLIMLVIYFVRKN